MKVTNFEISNYKSLVDFKAPSLGSTTVFFGENNAGKSNVLEALSLIFERKSQLVDDDLSEERINFYSGYLRDFQYCYYNNNFQESIQFLVSLECRLNDLNIDSETLNKAIKGKLTKNASLKFDLDGRIISVEGNSNIAEFKIIKIAINRSLIYSNEAEVHFLPTVDSDRSEQADSQKLFESIVENLNDIVFSIPSARDVFQEEFNSPFTEKISPQAFKKFLYTLYLSETGHRTFKEINRVFNAEPFSFGELSFAKIDDSLELMIEKEGIRLPIKSLGSGVLQILYIISSILYADRPIVCIEELEQNLSPKIQKLTANKLKEMLRGSGNPHQVILTSHSPYFYEREKDSSYLLEKQAGQTRIIARDGAEPRKDDEFEIDAIKLFKGHFPDHTDFY